MILCTVAACISVCYGAFFFFFEIVQILHMGALNTVVSQQHLSVVWLGNTGSSKEHLLKLPTGIFTCLCLEIFCLQTFMLRNWNSLHALFIWKWWISTLCWLIQLRGSALTPVLYSEDSVSADEAHFSCSWIWGLQHRRSLSLPSCGHHRHKLFLRSSWNWIWT